MAENRLSLAKDIGADEVLVVGKDNEDDLAKKVENKLGKMPEISIECSGAEASVRLGIFVSFF